MELHNTSKPLLELLGNRGHCRWCKSQIRKCLIKKLMTEPTFRDIYLQDFRMLQIAGTGVIFNQLHLNLGITFERQFISCFSHYHIDYILFSVPEESSRHGN